MTAQSIKAPLPQAPHPHTLADPYMTIANVERTQLVCYCPKHRCGAILHIEAGLWAIYCPLSLKEFCETLGEQGVFLPQGDDLRIWLQAIAMHTTDDAIH